VKKALLELHFNILFDACWNLKAVYQSRIKVDAFDSIKLHSENVLEQYTKMEKWYAK
jgi:hypothetical protein